MRTIAIIPARGGSKGIPRKNVKLIAGKPLVSHSICHAKLTPDIARVVVSTDDGEIAAVSREAGAEVVVRPADISGDTASSESGLAHALDYLKATENLEPDLVVFLQATSPLREPDDIQKALELMRRENSDSLFSACRAEGFVWRLEKDASPRSFTYDHQKRPRRQDAPEDLVENGSIYIFKPWVLRQFNSRLGGRISVYRMPALNSFQIDEPADLELVELLMRHRQCVAPNFSLAISFQLSAFKNVRLLALDFDGVLTDNRVLVMENGEEAVLCDRGDSLGLGMLKGHGVETVVISKEKNRVVSARCRKLEIECIQGCNDKLTALQALCSTRQLGPAEVAFVGNDVNDLQCLQWVGVPIAVADSAPAVIAAAQFKTPRAGGHGAVRDVVDWLLNARR